MAKLVLIDGHAILHRAYHALPPLTNKDGVQTNAVYGFMTMLLRVLENQKPDYLVVAFDRPEPTFRQQQYTQYQAKRPEMESTLADQIPLLHKLLDQMGICHFSLAGFEADDIIGTLAWQAVHRQELLVLSKKTKNYEPLTNNPIDVLIVTGDRDMLQLVNSQTKVLVPVKGASETKVYDEKTIFDEYGVRPSQWVDVKALKGDPSDNYPGVLGIGPKTAQGLIAKYGTLENLYKHLNELKLQLKLKLVQGVEEAGMGKKLATIITDVPVHLELEKAQATKINWYEGIIYMQEKLGFRSIAQRIAKDFLKEKAPSELVKPKKKPDNGQIRLI